MMPKIHLKNELQEGFLQGLLQGVCEGILDSKSRYLSFAEVEEVSQAVVVELEEESAEA